MAKDYSYLEGTEFFYNTGKRDVLAIVLYADYHVGLTCVAKENKDHYLICIRGHSSPKPSIKSKKGYQQHWRFLINKIEKGHISAVEAKENYNKYAEYKAHIGITSVSSNSCAFGQ